MDFITLDALDDATNGSSMKGYVEAPFSRLVEVFGEPGEGDGYKVAYEWRLKFADGTVATIYDWKETSLYEEGYPSPESLRRMDFADWHIGGFSADAVARVCEALSIEVTR